MANTPHLSVAERLRMAAGGTRASAAPARPLPERPSQLVPVLVRSNGEPVPVARRPAIVALNPEAAAAPEINPFERSRKQTLVEALTAAAIPSSTASVVDLTSARERMLDGLRKNLGADLVVPLAAAVPVIASATPSALTPRLSALARLRAAISEAPPTGLVANASDFGDFEPAFEEDGYADSSSRPVIPERVSITGRLITIKEFTGWAIGTLYNIENREEYRVKGEALMGLKEGLEYRLFGSQTTHAHHGEGFDVTATEPIISMNDDAISVYLVRSFDGIGPAKAEKYLKLLRQEGGDTAIDNLRNTLLTEPWKVDLTQIDARAKFSSGEDPQAEIKHLMVTRSLTIRLGKMPGFKEPVAKALASHLLYKVLAAHPTLPGEPAPEFDVVSETWALLMKNPYSPIRSTEGYGFMTAEAVATIVGLPKTSDLRLSALVEYAIDQGCQRKGHTYLSAAQLVEAVHRVDRGVAVQAALNSAVMAGCVVIDGKRVYSPMLHAAEISLAKNIAKLMTPAEALTARTANDVVRKLNKDPGKINPAFSAGFDKAQVDAVAGMMTGTSRIHVLTGGPGTGKTAIIEAILALLPNKTFAFAAPTGQAAKVLSERVSRYGYTATTMHSLLQGSEEGGFKVNAEEPLKVDVLVLDESTMNGVVMADAALSALPPHAHLIVLGDPGLPATPGVANSARAGQLPSISPGRFMQDLLLLPGINHVHLTKTYRNDGGILDVVQQTSRGNLITKDQPSVRFSHGLPTPEKGFPVVMQEYLSSVQRNGIENTLLVMPMRKGERESAGWNATYANHVLRATCNPHGEKIPGTSMFLGDRIIIRENMKIKQPKLESLGAVTRAPVYVDSNKSLIERLIESREPAKQDDSDFCLAREIADADDDEDVVTARVVNGDIGTIAAFAMASNNKRLGSPQWLELKLDDGRTVHYPSSEMASLQHSYALTVHSAQGSQRTNVMVVVTPGNEDFMNQTMLLTAFSRAQVDLSIHGDDMVIKKIVATPMPPRNSALVARVACNMEKAMADESGDSPGDSDEIPF